MPSRPSSTGRLRSIGVIRKCSSIARKPASISRKSSGPIAIISDSPIAESIEYRPPTQSQNPNMFSVSMPNSRTCAALVLTATKWRAMAASSRRLASSQSRAERALVSVSSVVNVLLLTMNRVSAGSRSTVASRRSAPSTLDTKRKRRDRSE